MERAYSRKRMSKGRRRKTKNRRVKRVIIRTISLLTVISAIFVLVVFLKSTFFNRVYKEHRVEAGTVLITQDFMKSNDYKGEFTDKSDEIDLSKPGEYILYIKSGWFTYKTKLIIEDTIAPQGELKDVTTMINGTVKPEDFFTEIIDATSVQVFFETEPDVSSAGDKKVEIIAIDAGGNVTKKQANLKVVEDEEAPKIFGADHICIQVGGSISYKKNITVIDNYDEEVELQVDSSKVNLNKVGHYEVIYTAVDKSGNKAETIIVVTVVEEEVPTEEMVNALADNILKTIFNNDMTQYDKAKSIFRWVHDQISYVDMAEEAYWTIGAYTGLTKRRGDCYVYAMTSKVLLTRAGITNLDIEKAESMKDHFWNLINIGEGWYHFDATRRFDGAEFFYVTDQVLWNYSNRNYNSHKYDPSLYPKIN